MPYIKQADRSRFHTALTDLPRIETAGELNYLITQLARLYISEHGLRYEHLNAVEGALSAASKEFYRRVVVPYEDQKNAENGDVYYVNHTGRCQ